MISQDKLFGLLGLANRANKIVYGEKAFETIADKKASLLLISDKASERTTEKLINRANYYKKPYFVIDDETLNDATGNQVRKYLVLIDKGFSKGIIDICRKRWRYG